MLGFGDPVERRWALGGLGRYGRGRCHRLVVALGPVRGRGCGILLLLLVLLVVVVVVVVVVDFFSRMPHILGL